MRTIHAIAIGILLVLFGAAPFAAPAQTSDGDKADGCCAKADGCCAKADGAKSGMRCSSEKGCCAKDSKDSKGMKCCAAHGKAGTDACCAPGADCCAKADGCCAGCKHG